MQLACRRAKLSVKRAVGRVSVATAAHFDSNADDRSRLPYGALILQLCANSPNSAKLNVAAAPETNAPRHYPLIRLGIRAVSLLSATATATADLNVPFFPALSFCGFCLPPPPSPSSSRPALPFFLFLLYIDGAPVTVHRQRCRPCSGLFMTPPTTTVGDDGKVMDARRIAATIAIAGKILRHTSGSVVWMSERETRNDDRRAEHCHLLPLLASLQMGMGT